MNKQTLQNALATTDDFRQIVLQETPLIDVRAPIEYEKGAFPKSVNLPLMNNEERHQVGICYKEQGNASAVALGHQLVSGEIKQQRIEAWKAFIEAYPNAMLYCFRGGQRSRIAQQWLQEAGVEIVRLNGGYKAFRQYLLQQLDQAAQQLQSTVMPIVLAGPTGSGKTRVLHNIEQTLDLEGIANHRGSAFGAYLTPQPTQIDFENSLAYAFIQAFEQQWSYMVFEDENRNIGSVHLPTSLFEAIKSGPKVIVDTPMEKRIEYTVQEYVEWEQAAYIRLYGEVEAGLLEWRHHMEQSLNRIQRRLGGELHQRIMRSLDEAVTQQEESHNPMEHAHWIKLLLTEYYDPMYAYQLKKNSSPILFKGEPKEVVAFFRDYQL